MLKMLFGAFGFTPPVFKIVVYAHIFWAGYYVWTKSEEVYVQIKPVVLAHLDQALIMIDSIR